MSLQNCYNFDDFRKLAKKKLPSPIFHYIDGGADDEITLKRNTKSFDDCDLVPNILASVGKPDLSTTIFGKKIDMPLFLSPCAMQDFIIMTVTKHLLERLISLEHFIVCLRWQITLLRKFQIFQVDQSYFNFMFTKINQSLMI